MSYYNSKTTSTETFLRKRREELTRRLTKWENLTWFNEHTKDKAREGIELELQQVDYCLKTLEEKPWVI